MTNRLEEMLMTAFEDREIPVMDDEAKANVVAFNQAMDISHRVLIHLFERLETGKKVRDQIADMKEFCTNLSTREMALVVKYAKDLAKFNENLGDVMRSELFARLLKTETEK